MSKISHIRKIPFGKNGGGEDEVRAYCDVVRESLTIGVSEDRAREAEGLVGLGKTGASYGCW